MVLEFAPGGGFQKLVGIIGLIAIVFVVAVSGPSTFAASSIAISSSSSAIIRRERSGTGRQQGIIVVAFPMEIATRVCERTSCQSRALYCRVCPHCLSNGIVHKILVGFSLPKSNYLE